MKPMYQPVTQILWKPLLCATAGLSLLSGCHLLSCHRSGASTSDSAYYQPSAPAHSSSSNYEEPAGINFDDPAPEPPPPPDEELPPQPKAAAVPKLLPSEGHKPSTTEQSTSSKLQKIEKPTTEELKSSTSEPSKIEIRILFESAESADSAETDESESDSSETVIGPLELSHWVTSGPGAQTVILVDLEVPPEPEPADPAPKPRELPHNAAKPRSLSDRIPMFLAPSPPGLQSTKTASVPMDVAKIAPPEVDDPSEPINQSSNGILTLDASCDHLVFDQQGNGYVSQRDQIVRFTPSGEMSAWATLTAPKGHQVEADGTHLVCDPEQRAVLRLAFDGKVIGIAAKECSGVPLRAPFDLALDANGGFFFTDPGFLQMKESVGKVYHVDRFGAVRLVASKLGYPTGICFDVQKRRLLVVESLSAKIVELRLSELGRVTGTQKFASLTKSKDVECHVASLCQSGNGTLFVTQSETSSVQVINSKGRSVGQLTTGEMIPSRVALRSPDATEVFISGATQTKPLQGLVIRVALGD